MRVKSFKYIAFIIILFSINKCFGQDDRIINRAGEYFIDGNVKRGIAQLEMAIARDSNNARAYYNLGNFNTSLGNFDKAIMSYIKASELYPKYVETSALVGSYPKYYECIDNLALVYLAIGKYGEAIKLTEESSMPGYDSDQPLRTSYLSYFLSHNQPKGLELFHKYKLLQHWGDQVKTDSSLIYAFNENKLSEIGFLSYLKASLITASPTTGLQYLKTALDELPSNEFLIKLKEEYTDPDYDDKRTEKLKIHNKYLKALNLSQNNYIEEAMEIIDDLVDDESNNLSYLELQAALRFSSDKQNEAIEISRKMLILDAKAPSIWYNLGNYYFRMDSLEQAEICFSKSLELNPEYPESNSFLGSIFWMKDSNYTKAKMYYDKEIEINPKNEETYYNAGKLSFLNENYEEAAKYLNQLIVLNPYDLEARARLIQVYETMGDLKGAINLTKESLNFVKEQNKEKKIVDYFQRKKEELESK